MVWVLRGDLGRNQETKVLWIWNMRGDIPWLLAGRSLISCFVPPLKETLIS